ncbi:MAG: replication restart helicase PriA [Candidatus Dormibacteria bacterium]
MSQNTEELGGAFAHASGDGHEESPVSRLVAVVLDTTQILPHDTLTYRVPEHLGDIPVVGKRVVVPFRNATLEGFVIEHEESTQLNEVREIGELVDGVPELTSWQRNLAVFIARRYVASLSEVVKTMVPKPVRIGRVPRASKNRSNVLKEHAEVLAPTLNAEQETAASAVIAAVTEHRSERFLLHGVTGSGKTEVYLAAIEESIRQGRQAIMLVPEIALTPQTLDRFRARFHDRVAVLHSALTDAMRAREWWRIYRGEVDVVVGSRSAIFAPVQDLGIIVVDEEDSSSYKQERHPRYHAVEVAFELGKLRNAPVVLGSATPRIEMFYRAHGKDVTLLTLTKRFNGRELPPVEVVDLRQELRAGNHSMLSKELLDAIRTCHEGGGQSLLFLNRRGLATLVLCRTCGFVLTCTQCSANLVHHHSTGMCHCHYCGRTEALPTICPSCSAPKIRQLGGGTERVEQEVREAVPGIRILRMDRDTMHHRDAYEDAYRTFSRHEADCLIGTQMVAKGWDLTGVRLVGIVNADGSLHFPDYRSAEVTFSLLTQVAGRTGRGDEPARVLLQTYTPEHFAIQAAARHDYRAFAHEEIRIRKSWNFPPFREMVVCIASHKSNDKARIMAEEAVNRISGTIAPDMAVEVLGPTPAPMHQVKGEFRWQFIVRGQQLQQLYEYLPKGAGWNIDVDPSM